MQKTFCWYVETTSFKLPNNSTMIYKGFSKQKTWFIISTYKERWKYSRKLNLLENKYSETGGKRWGCFVSIEELLVKTDLNSFYRSELLAPDTGHPYLYKISRPYLASTSPKLLNQKHPSKNGFLVKSL